MLGRHYAMTISAQVAQAVLGFVTLFALARVLGPGDFGITVLLTAVVTIGAIALSAGMQASVLVLAAKQHASHAQLSGLATSIGVGIAGVLGAAVLAVGDVQQTWTGLDTAIVGFSAARIGPTVFVGLITTALSGAGRIGSMALVNVAGGVTGLCAPAGALLAPEALFGAVAGALVGNVAWAAVVFAVAARQFGWAVPTRRDLWVDVIRLAVPLHVGTLAYWIMLRADAFVVYAFADAVTLGHYALALTLSERVTIIVSPLYNVTAWRVSGRDAKLGLATVLTVARIEIAAAVAFGLGVIVLGAPVIELLAGPAFIPVAGPLAILVIGAALLPVWATLGLFLASQADRAWYTAQVQVMVAAVAVVGYLAAVPLAGMYGAALVSTGSYVALLVAGFRGVAKGHPIRARQFIPTLEDYAGLRAAIGSMLSLRGRGGGRAGS